MPYKDNEKNNACQRAWYAANKEQQRARHRAYYAANKERIKAHNEARRQRHRAILNRYKRMKGCAICGESRPACLDLHALHGHTEKCISGMINHSWPKIKAEVFRCIVLCANHHRLVHADEVELPRGEEC